MHLSWKENAIPVVGLALCAAPLLLAGCKKNERPVASSADYTTLEETAVAGRLQATDTDGDALTYYVGGAQHGHLSVDRSTGDFSFEPDVDFYGTASFRFYVSDGELATPFVTVSITVENVNDPPQIASVPALQNSAETEFVEYQVTAVDPDPDQPSFSVAVADPSVVDATIDGDTGRLSLKALQIGATSVEVIASDGEYSDAAVFDFAADEVTKTRRLFYSEPNSGAVVLKNDADQPIDFVLKHNGFPVFENVESIVTYVEEMPAQFAGEDFPRKLWRFVRDSVYHDVPLNAKRLHYDSWVTLNSLGWGFCGHVAGVYVIIAEAAGYEARVWGLSGHVVPEIKVDGQWRMYDPDLAIYYKTADGRVAGVEELAANPALVTQPIDPIFAGSSYQFPYDPFIADVYATTNNNYDGVNTFLPAHETPSARIVVPPGATLTYPGRWTGPPTGYDGTVPYVVRHFEQAMLKLEDGWTGEVTLPWMAWEVSGAGQVGIGGTVFDVGSLALTNRLRNTNLPVTSLHVYAGTGIRIVFFVNAVRFNIQQETHVSIRGLNVWGMAVGDTGLPPESAAGASIDGSLRKVLPTTL